VVATQEQVAFAAVFGFLPTEALEAYVEAMGIDLNQAGSAPAPEAGAMSYLCPACDVRGYIARGEERRCWCCGGEGIRQR